MEKLVLDNILFCTTLAALGKTRTPELVLSDFCESSDVETSAGSVK